MFRVVRLARLAPIGWLAMAGLIDASPVTAQRVRIPAGSYAPLYAASAGTRVAVAAFAIDREPVTRAEFQRFVMANPAWRRGATPDSLAEGGYLRDWVTPTDPGAQTLRRPVTDVSRRAAEAYCAARGGRLPTTEEWEYVAAASAARRDAGRDPARLAQLVAVYSSRAGHAPGEIGHASPNAYGVADLHELVWEWTADVASSSKHSQHHSHHHTAASEDTTHHLGCASAAMGAPDPGNYPAFLRYAFRTGLEDRTTTGSLGFRCVSSS